MSREVAQRFTSSVFAGVRDLRLRLRNAKGTLLCVAVVGFAGGELVTSTATSDTPLTAMVGALDGLPERMDRIHRVETRPAALDDASVRAEVKRLLERAVTELDGVSWSA